jgi:diketogulonate reductase-like aldo/keto reductase
MPMVGFGTYRFKDGAAHRATTEALRAGYRLIDTAFCYGGEKVLIASRPKLLYQMRAQHVHCVWFHFRRPGALVFVR